MIQFNLLPDVKLQYIKAQRTKHTVVTISVLAGAAALVLFVFLILSVDVVQKKLMSDKSKQINQLSSEIRKTPNLSKMLTVQAQLNQLTALHDSKPVMSRLLEYMNKLTPTSVSISQLSLDNQAKTMVISGTADTLDSVNAFTDSLKYTTYQVDGSDQPAKNAFSNVVLTNINRDSTRATFSLSLSFDDTIFNNAGNVTLTVNKSVAEQAAAIITKGQ